MKLLYQEDETALWWGVGVVRLMVLVIVVFKTDNIVMSSLLHLREAPQ